MKCRIVIAVIVGCFLVIGAKADESIPTRTAVSGRLILSSDSAQTALAPIQSSAPSQLPDQLNLYQQGMQMIFQQTWENLEQIAQAADMGAMNREEAAYASMELYQRAMLSFQLLRTLYRSTKDEMRKNEAPRPETGLQVLGTAITVTPTASSSDIPEQVAKFLELTPPQVAAIQAEIIAERDRQHPLIDQLAANSRALAAMGYNGRFDQKQVRKLAAEQAKILQKLIVANAELDQRLYNILTVTQQHRADELRALHVVSAEP